MSDSFEQGLRKLMTFLGRGVEAVIGKAKSASAHVGTRGGVKPILSLDSQLRPARIAEIISASVERVMKNSIPDIKGGIALEVGEDGPMFSTRIIGMQAKLSVCVEVSGKTALRQGTGDRGFVIRGEPQRLPFGNARFSYLIAQLATPLRGDIMRAARELGRVLLPGGQGVIVDYHPFGLYAKRGDSKIRPIDASANHFEDYYRICKQSDLRVVDVREVFVDESMRQMFKPDEISAYRNLKGTPLVIFIFIYKPKGTK